MTFKSARGWAVATALLLAISWTSANADPPVTNSPPIVPDFTDLDSFEDVDLVIRLPGSDPDGDPLQAFIHFIYEGARVYQYDEGQRGAEILNLPAVVTDPERRIIFVVDKELTQSVSSYVFYRLSDGMAESGQSVLLINYFFINDPPSFVKGPDQVANEGGPAETVVGWATQILPGPLEFAEMAPVNFIVQVDNSSLFILPPTLSEDGTLRYRPARDASGTAIIRLVLKDEQGTNYGGNDTSAEQQFSITVRSVNDQPSFQLGNNPNLLEDAPRQILPGFASAINLGPSNEANQTGVFLVTNENANLFLEQPTIDSQGTLTFAPAANMFGTALVRVRLQDDGGVENGALDTSVEHTFTVVLISVNDPPAFKAGSDLIALEDAGPQIISGWATGVAAGPSNEADQSVTFRVSNDNPALFIGPPAISLDGALTFRTAPNQTGTATVSVQLQDTGGENNLSASQSFTLTVLPVNEPPSFRRGPDPSVSEDSGPTVIAGWATEIAPGPANESAQKATFSLENDHPTFFTESPAISGDGTLRFRPAQDAHGIVTVSVVLVDDGGTAHGGVNRSTAQRFTIEIRPENDCPVVQARVVPPFIEERAGTNFTVIAPNNTTALVLFDGSQTSDVDGDALSYGWFEVPRPEPASVIAASKPPKHPELSFPPGCASCRGEVTRLSLRYTGEQAQRVRVTRKKGDLLFDQVVSPDMSFSVVGIEGATLGKEIIFAVAGTENARLRTDCSRRIGPGLVLGDFVILSGFSERGGELCQLAAIPVQMPEPFGDEVVAERELFVGRHVIMLEVTDGTCRGNAQIEVTVITPGTAVEKSIEKVDDSEVARKDKRALLELLTHAAHDFDQGKFKQGTKKLHAYLQKLEVLERKRIIAPATAAAFASDIQAILHSLED